MSARPSSDGKLFLEGLILQAETILGKMIFKLHRTDVQLAEMVPMINSVYDFVNLWDGPLKEITLEMLHQPRAVKSNEDAIMEQVSQLDRPDDPLEVVGEGRKARSKRLVRIREDSEPVFEFPEQSLKDYKANNIGVCVISFVGPAERCFCMVDRNQRDCTKLFAAMQNTRGLKLTTLPAIGEVFGVYLDGSLFRAVRNKPVERSPLKTPYIRLLDTGEVLPYDDSMLLCALSEYYRKLPAFAIRCVLVAVMNDPFCDDLHQYLQKNLHSNQYYQIVSVERSTLFIKLSQSPIASVQKPFKPPKELSAKAASIFSCSKPQPSLPRMNIFTPETMEQKNAPSFRLPMSVVPPQDKPTCPFFELDGSNCASGVHSKSAAVPGSSSPSDDVYILPPVGSEVYLVPKFIRDVEHFWCHVVSPDYDDPVLLEMEMKMNDPENSKQYKKLDRVPGFTQKVFAKYVDKRWYRAEVAQYFDENNVLVFYVDYGNAETVRLEEMRQWDERFSYLPYQAVLCRIAHIQCVKPYHKQAVVEMNRKLLNKRVLATIVNNGTPWEVTIVDKDGFDFSIGLVMAGLAKKIKPDDEDDTDSSDEDALAAVEGA